MPNVLEIDNLSKDYGDFKLKDVSFALPQGYIMGLIGPNGAGKTTIIKLILNLIRKDGGDIRVFGFDNLKEEVEIKGRIGFVHDTPFFYEHLTLKKIESTVAPFYKDWDKALFSRLLGEFNLPEGKVFGKLSRGMKMKFSLAVALSHGADFIILDEPTSGLDPVFRRQLLARLWALIQDEKKSVLFSTHITSDLEKIADYITFIHHGEIVFSSTRDEVLENWGLVKGGNNFLDAQTRELFRAVRRREFGFEALTSNLAEARRRLPDGVLIERASLEDIMFYVTRGNSHA
jgi:ABC-2 type transport system ATP-binding protein